MEVERTPLEGVLLIKPKIWGDERGYFVETWQQERYREAGAEAERKTAQQRCPEQGGAEERLHDNLTGGVPGRRRS